MDLDCLDCGQPKNQHFSTFNGVTGIAWCNTADCAGYAFVRFDGARVKDGQSRPPIDEIAARVLDGRRAIAVP